MSRVTIRLAAASACVVLIAISVWLLIGPSHGRASDCKTAQAMWSYYELQMASERAAAADGTADNTQSEETFRKMGNELQTFANRISTPEIRSKADDIVAANHDMFERWKSWAASSQSSDEEFGREFTNNARKLETAHAGLQRECR